MNHRISRAAACTAILTGGAIALSGAAGASPSTKFTQEQQQLEQQLANRSTQLQHLVSDVSGSKTLTTSDAETLSTRLGSEVQNINALIASVPNDTMLSQLNQARQSMLQDNRVYAVMTPQVFITINADATASSATTLAGNESTLQSEVSSLVGQQGYQNALNHFDNYVKRVNNVQGDMATAVTNVLAQSPSGYPGNTHVFTNANHTVLNANVGLAYASYDASVIALAAGGYTGS